MESENHPSVDLKIRQPGGLAPACVPEGQWFPNTAGTGSLQHGLDLLKGSVSTLKHSRMQDAVKLCLAQHAK